MSSLALILLISALLGGIAGTVLLHLIKAMREEEKRLGMFGMRENEDE